MFLGLLFDVSAGQTLVKQFAILLLLLSVCVKLIQKKSWPCLLSLPEGHSNDALALSRVFH